MERILFRTLGVPSHRPHVGMTHFRSHQTSVRHTHDFFEVFLVTSGSGTHHINRRRVALSAGHLVAIQPEDRHHFSIRQGEAMAIINVAMARAWWTDFHRLMGSSISIHWHRLGDPPGHLLLARRELLEMQRAFERLSGLDKRPPSDVVDALLRVIASFQSCDQGVPLRPPAWLEKWKMAVIEAGEEIAEPIHYWQKRSGRSPEHPARSCRAFFLCTPTDLLNHRRIERAKVLLRSTDEKVISIAYACGFGNLANFYRNFSARAGMLPRTWRQQAAATVPVSGGE